MQHEREIADEIAQVARMQHEQTAADAASATKRERALVELRAFLKEVRRRGARLRPAGTS